MAPKDSKMAKQRAKALYDDCPFTFPCIASWMDTTHGQISCLGQLTGEERDVYLRAEFSPTRCDYRDTNAYIRLVLSPVTIDNYGKSVIEPANRVALTITREHLADPVQMNVFKQSETAPAYVQQEFRGRGLFLVQLCLKQAPAVMMPKNPGVLRCAGEYGYVMALRALSNMKSIDIWVPHADRVVWKTRRFQRGVQRDAGSVAPIPPTHYTPSGDADVGWSKFCVQEWAEESGQTQGEDEV